VNPVHNGILNTTLCNKICQGLSPVSSTNKTDRHEIAEILLKVALNTTNLTQTFAIYGKITKMLINALEK
jgi:hypothetical protein